MKNNKEKGGFSKSLNNKLLPAVGKIQNNKWTKSLSDSFMALLPIGLTGALFALLQGLQNMPFGEGFTEFWTKTGIGTIIDGAVTACTLFALYLVVSLGYNLGKMKGQNPFNTAMIALMAFVFVTPFTASNTADNGVVTVISNVVSTQWLGAQGIFTAIFVGIVSTVIYSFLIKKNIKIKVPDSLPDAVARSFEALLPSMIVGLIFIAIRALFSFTEFGSLHEFIYSIIQTPLTQLGSTFPAYMICMFLVCLLWIFGVHGSIIVTSIMLPIWTPLGLEIFSNFSAGIPIGSELSGVFFYVFLQFLGGPGCLIGLVIVMSLTARSKRYKAMGKISLVPGIFNIVEPVMYGFPIVLNPIMAIPFMLTPLLFMTITYLLIQVNFLLPPVIPALIPILPAPIGGFLLGAGWKMGVWLIVLSLISCLIYLPFFKYCDRQALKEERVKEQSQKEQLAAENQ